MKKIYLKPVTQVVRMKMYHQLLADSLYIRKATGNAGLDENISGGFGENRSRDSDGWWDDEE